MIEQYPVWDQDALLGRMRGKTDRVLKLVNLFLDDMPDQIDQLNVQLHSLERVSEIAHTIKGVSANLSVLRLHQTAAQLEEAAKNAESEQTRELLSAIDEIYKQSETELRAFVSSHNP